MPPHLAGHLAMLGFSAAVAGSFALGSRAANFIDPSVMTAARFWIAALVLLALSSVSGQARRSAARAPWRYFVLAALMSFYFVTMFEGLKTATPVSTAAVFTLTPILSAAFGWMLMRQRFSARMGLALALGGIGALWVIFRADWAAFAAFDVGRGEAIFFAGCVAHAVYTPLVARFKRGEGVFAFAFGTVLAGAILLTIWAAPAIMATPWGELPAIVWITLAYISLFASAASFALLQFAATRLPSAKVMAYTYLTPTWVIGWELALGAGGPRPLILVGIGLIVCALVLLLRDEHGPARAVSPA
ncbi:DMT family transporter [Salipiger sp. IMCC34102]|uniref:DMT family transporter n=1 Tax=Salipiger sp. IMCC34102 TaxID=2510647 RepID=UPI00101CB4F4|nr:DMT family transporter [Salipiger sp. IMCC34102]RYH03984.1 DMT family transporter [Salipiger sp. IMCC34102]